MNAAAKGCACLIAPGAVLWLVALLAAASACAVLTIDGRGIDHTMARGSDEEGNGKSKPSGLRVIFECKPLLLFTAAITLFHFANAAMLPLIGERLSQGQKGAETLFMAACIITAQIAMVPMAMLVGAKADAWGRKPLFLVGFAALPIRGVLYTLWSDPYYLVSIQLLDGIGAGIFGALFLIVIADLTKGTGHYNLALGAASAAWGLGAALSNSVAGFIVDRAGFNAAFLFLAAMASLAFLLFWLAVPDMANEAKRLRSTPTNRRPETRRRSTLATWHQLKHGPANVGSRNPLLAKVSRNRIRWNVSLRRSSCWECLLRSGSMPLALQAQSAAHGNSVQQRV
jgi:MFS family permease